jgi:hypothetical protein
MPAYEASNSIVLLIYFIILVSTVIGTWKIFEKAGVAGILALIPIVNTVYMFKIAGLNPWLILTLFIPFVNIVVMLFFTFKFIESYGFGLIGFLAYMFISPIMILYMRFSGNVKYVGEVM